MTAEQFAEVQRALQSLYAKLAQPLDRRLSRQESATERQEWTWSALSPTERLERAQRELARYNRWRAEHPEYEPGYVKPEESA